MIPGDQNRNLNPYSDIIQVSHKFVWTHLSHSITLHGSGVEIIINNGSVNPAFLFYISIIYYPFQKHSKYR